LRRTYSFSWGNRSGRNCHFCEPAPGVIFYLFCNTTSFNEKSPDGQIGLVVVFVEFGTTKKKPRLMHIPQASSLPSRPLFP
jgi:hypothetical protein